MGGERGDIVTWARPAGADLSLAQYAPVTLDADLKVALANLTSDFFGGILQNKPKTDEGATVAVEGMSKARAGGAVTGGRFVKVQSAWFIAATSGDRAHGKAWSTVVSGGIFTCQILDSQLTLTASHS
jgi:hypothetical protein